MYIGVRITGAGELPDGARHTTCRLFYHQVSILTLSEGAAMGLTHGWVERSRWLRLDGQPLLPHLRLSVGCTYLQFFRDE